MIAGITGHQDLGSVDTMEWVRSELDSLVVSERVVSGLTSLAVGADQVFASVLQQRGLAFEVVIPSAAYESAFPSDAARARYLELLAAASGRVALPFPEPTEQSFFEAGKYITLHSDVLFAVWNGGPAKGLGGTADVVRFAQFQERRTIQLNPVTRTIVRL